MNRQNVWGPVLLAPALLLLVFFYLLPILYSVRLSLYDVGFVEDIWVAGENYRHLLSQGGYWAALRATSKFLAVYLFTVLIMAYVLALGLRKFSDRFCGATLTIYYVPSIFSGIIVITAWRWFYRYPDGGLNGILNRFGLSGMSWLGNPVTAPWAVGFTMMGMLIGGTTLLYLAAIGGVHQEIIEAAQMDGAGEWQTIRHIITPLTHRARLYLLLTSMIGGFTVWEHPFFYTSGGPLGSTTTVMLKIYHKAFIEGDLGMGNAMTALTVLFVLGLSIIVIRYLREFLG